MQAAPWLWQASASLSSRPWSPLPPARLHEPSPFPAELWQQARGNRCPSARRKGRRPQERVCTCRQQRRAQPPPAHGRGHSAASQPLAQAPRRRPQRQPPRGERRHRNPAGRQQPRRGGHVTDCHVTGAGPTWRPPEGRPGPAGGERWRRPWRCSAASRWCSAAAAAAAAARSTGESAPPHVPPAVLGPCPASLRGACSASEHGPAARAPPPARLRSGRPGGHEAREAGRGGGGAEEQAARRLSAPPPRLSGAASLVLVSPVAPPEPPSLAAGQSCAAS